MSDAFFAALRALNDKATTVDRDIRKWERDDIEAFVWRKALTAPTSELKKTYEHLAIEIHNEAHRGA